MALIVCDPAEFKTQRAYDGVVVWHVKYSATGYNLIMFTRYNAEMIAAFNEGIGIIDIIRVQHTTTAADERSGVYIYAPIANYIGDFESDHTLSKQEFHGPWYLIGAHAAGQYFIAIGDDFSEWSGNCNTTIIAQGRIIPKEATTPNIPAPPTPVVVDEMRVWPWKR